MLEAVFQIGIGGAGQGLSWCPDRTLPYKNCWHRNESWAQKSRHQYTRTLLAYSMPCLCKLYILPLQSINSKIRGKLWSNWLIKQSWPSPMLQLKSPSIELALSSVPSLTLKQCGLFTSIISCHLPSWAPSNKLQESQKMASKYLQIIASYSDNSNRVLQTLKAFKQKVTAEDEE